TTRMQFGTLESSLTRSITETEGRTIPSSARPAGDASIGTARRLETTNTILDTKLVTPIGDQHVVTTGAQYWDAELEDGLVPNPYTQ
ncbi:TonB-dependent receptor, partial [Klebsiella pneumoniae]|nr:TonB-dependent receptor [Klebsiella pneumoniae]